MRRFLISTAAAAAATMALAAPASAQYGQGRYEQRDQRGSYEQRDQGGYAQRGGYGQRGYAQNRVDRQAVNQLVRELDRAENQIQRGIQRGTVSRREADGLRREAASIRQAIYRSNRNGLSRGEYNQLRQRIDRLEQRVRIERRDRDNRRW